MAPGQQPPLGVKPDCLASIFQLKHASACSLRTVQEAQLFVELWAQFVKQLQTGCDDALLRPAIPALVRATGILTSNTVTWYPANGCALLALGPPRGGSGSGSDTSRSGSAGASGQEFAVVNAGSGSIGADDADDKDVRADLDSLNLLLVCLDMWEYRAHSMSDGRIQHTASCPVGAHTLMPCGSIDASQLTSLVETVARFEDMMVKRRGEGEKGLQRTPGFIRNLIKCAIMDLRGELGKDAKGMPDIPPPHGGFTDVGQHTGCAPRDTCWPIVRETVQALLARATPGCSNPRKAFQRALAHFDLWLLQQQLALLTPASATPKQITSLMQMLRSAADKAAALAAEGFDISALEADCAAAAAALRAAASRRALAAAEPLTLPPAGSAAPAWVHPSGVLPAVGAPAADEGGLESFRQRSARNLGSLPLPPSLYATPASSSASTSSSTAIVVATPGSTSASRSFRELLEVVGKLGGQGAALQHKLKCIERELFALAASADAIEQAAGDRLADVDESDALEAVVDVYRVAAQTLMGLKESQGCMLVELRSRELLVVWAAYCLMHAAAGKQHPLVFSYGVALQWTDLQHLVLDSRPAVTAALGLAHYLHRHSCQHARQPALQLFSLRALDSGGAGTFTFAREFAQQDPELRGLWEDEVELAQERVEMHWAEVVRKQQLAAHLRQTLEAQEEVQAEQKQKLAEAEQEASHHPYRHGRDNAKYWEYSRKVEKCQGQVNNIASSIRGTQSQLDAALRSPLPVVQPLPQSQAAALPWLFFLHMPPRFRQLSRMSFLAQQMLLPRAAGGDDAASQAAGEEVRKAIEVQPYKTNLTSHYNTQRIVHTYLSNPNGTTPAGNEGAVWLRSRQELPQTADIGPRSVDSFTSKDQGVWWPDGLTPSMAWAGSRAAVADDSCGFAPGTPFNPFASVNERLIADCFTERLRGPGAKALQPFMFCSGVPGAADAARGNLAIATQGAKPSWLSKPAYLACGALRAAPLRQLHRLCADLRDRTLPLAQPDVQMLLRQAVYQLGPLVCNPAAPGGAAGAGGGPRPTLLWRAAWEGEGSVMAVLAAELASLAGELHDNQREHEAVAVLGELAAYVADWRPEAEATARRFARMTAAVADALEGQVAALMAAPAGGTGSTGSGAGKSTGGADAEQVAALRAKQARWRSMALGCYAAGPLDAAGADAAAMVLLMVQLHHTNVYNEHKAVRQQLGEQLLRGQRVMAARADELLRAVRADPGVVLTPAVQRVLQRAPDTLAWRQLYAGDASTPLTASFQAIVDERKLYCINVLDGAVLYNGCPPDRLPAEITGHLTFIRTFGTTNFEVQRGSEPGVLQTISPMCGRFYDFYLAPAQGESSIKRLVVTEVDREKGVKLQLLSAAGGFIHTSSSRYATLPLRLLERHSHWVCRQRGVIVVRPPHFQRHQCHFIIKIDDSTAADAAASGGAGSDVSSSPYDVRRVPPHLRSRHWTELAGPLWDDLPDSLVLTDRGSIGSMPSFGNVDGLSDLFARVLAKFEDLSFIHVHTPSGPAAQQRQQQQQQEEEGTGAAEGQEEQQLQQQRKEQAPERQQEQQQAHQKQGPQADEEQHQQQGHQGDEQRGEQQQQQQQEAGKETPAQCSSDHDDGGAGVVGPGAADGTAAGHANYDLLYELPRYGLEFELKAGELHSRDYVGYRLRRCQQLVSSSKRASSSGTDGDRQRKDSSNSGGQESNAKDDGAANDIGGEEDALYTLPEFCQYLVLERLPISSGDSSGAAQLLHSRRADVLVLVPCGEVLKGVDGSVHVSVESAMASPTARAGLKLKAHCYEVHGRFGHLTAPSILARLQLAALYAATSTLLPEPLARVTGVQIAMQLLRQSWVNRPLTPEEGAQLRSACRLGGYLADGLPLLAQELLASSCQLQHLHPQEAAPAASGASGRRRLAPLDADAGAAWEHECRQLRASGWESSASLRVGITELEEERVMGTSRPCPEEPEWQYMQQYTPIEVPASGILSSVVSDIEQELLGLVRLVRSADGGSGNSNSDSRRQSRMCSGSSADGSGGAARSSGGGSEGSGRDGEQSPAASPIRGAASSGADSGGATSGLPPYPLEPASAPSGGEAPSLESAMHAELKDSWEAHHRATACGEQGVDPGALGVIRQKQAEVSDLRSRLESHLLHHTTHVPATVGSHGAAFRALQSADTTPTASPLDLMRFAWQPELIQRFNPFLSDDSRDWLHGEALTWLQMCVLEDRLRRLAALAEAGPEHGAALVQELLTHRTWSVPAHPKWLVFEAEGGLQIRPQQHTVAQHLLDNPGAIVQLNMGEGKTRVILPMLALHWADGNKLVRLTFLSTLLDEAFAHLHATLTASVLGVKLFTQPFHRDVAIDEAGARAMRASLEYCKQAGGLLLVAPEHRLSLCLKWHELRARGTGDAKAVATMAALDRLNALPYQDILDESDELLHHRLQLIYAMGGARALPSCTQRVAAVQVALRLLSRRLVPGSGLLREGVAVFEPPEAKPGCFSGIRLLPGAALDAAWPALCATLARAVVQQPSHELRWLRGCGQNDPELVDRIVRCIIDQSLPAESALVHHPLPTAGEANATTGSRTGSKRSSSGEGDPSSVSSSSRSGLAADQWHQVLALRGLLAYGLLPHCLQKRVHVEYGINRRPDARKRLAVPFRAAHTPSERSEWAQPDVALVLTHLAYYRDGLSRGQLRDALAALMRMGRAAQEAEYEEWLQLSAAAMKPEHHASIDSAAKLDPSNALQLELLHAYYSHNQAAVDFFLAQCVLPGETQQFPTRLGHSAWHLAENARGQVVGFSGTNDNHRLLPLQVRQSETADTALRGTNGTMLAVLLGNPTYHTLRPQAQQPVWQAVLCLALSRRLSALIDCGALLAGTTNRAAAEYVAAYLDSSRLQGVCYYDMGLRCWAILDLRGRTTPRSASPLPERDTFVIFDDARCRGADLQLRRDAAALLTLGPGITKDKVMQAAGRLRAIGRGQSVQFVGTADISEKIRKLAVAAEAARGEDQAPSTPPPQRRRTRQQSEHQGAQEEEPQQQRQQEEEGRGQQEEGQPGQQQSPPQRQRRQPRYRTRCVGPQLPPEELQQELEHHHQQQQQQQQAQQADEHPTHGELEDDLAHASASKKQRRTPIGAAAADSAAAAAASAATWTPPEPYPPLTSHHVLTWVMASTVQSTLHGVVQWAAQGLQFAASKDAPDRVPQPEVLELEGLYGGGRAPQPVHEVVTGMWRRVHRHSGAAARGVDSAAGGSGSSGSPGSGPGSTSGSGSPGGNPGGGGSPSGCSSRTTVSPGARAMMAEIRDKAYVHGEGFQVASAGRADEECERELEKQEEKEKEKEVQVASVQPAEECNWVQEAALSAASVSHLQNAARGLGIYPLKFAARWLHPPALRQLPWSDRAFCTANHLLATAEAQALAESASRGSGALNEYLRPVDAMLLLPSGELLLLSEREADALVCLMQRHQSSGVANGGGSAPILLNLSAARLAHGIGASASGGPLPLACSVRQRQVPPEDVQRLLGAAELAGVQLFNGDTNYSGAYSSGTAGDTSGAGSADASSGSAMATSGASSSGASGSSGSAAAVQAALRQLVRGQREAAEALVSMRGKLPLWSRSDLEAACE